MLLTQEELQQALEVELQRLIIKGLTPEQEVLARRYYSDKEREGMDEGEFCGPHKSFPITSAADVSNAAHLIGHADDPASVKACIIRKAKKNGWALPDAWKEDGGKEDRTVGTTLQVSDRISMSLPLVRIDSAKREVWGQATAEVPDSYGTIFGYYPDAWTKWRGNIREQHDPKKAVGRRIELECDDLTRSINVGSRVSRGAQDTWLKVEDNVLTGYSASVIPDAEFGSDPKRWPKKQYDGKEYPYLPRYTVAELSLVDSPACPNCNIQIVRADGFATDVLDTEEDPNTPVSASSLPLDRVGARVSAPTRAANHEAIAHVLRGAVSMMKNCGPDCDSCMAAQKMIDPDGDGDIDIGSFDDPDKDADDLYNGRDADMRRSIETLVERILEQKFTSVTQRLHSIAGALARSHPTGDSLNRTMESSLAEVRASLEAVKEQVDKIANTPVPGAPVMNSNAIPKPTIEKRLPTDPYQPLPRSGSSVYDALARMSERGELDTLERQTDAITAGLIAQRRGNL
jgi:hypothetical protein